MREGGTLRKEGKQGGRGLSFSSHGRQQQLAMTKAEWSPVVAKEKREEKKRREAEEEEERRRREKEGAALDWKPAPVIQLSPHLAAVAAAAYEAVSVGRLLDVDAPTM